MAGYYFRNGKKIWYANNSPTTAGKPFTGDPNAPMSSAQLNFVLNLVWKKEAIALGADCWDRVDNLKARLAGAKKQEASEMIEMLKSLPDDRAVPTRDRNGYGTEHQRRSLAQNVPVTAPSTVTQPPARPSAPYAPSAPVRVPVTGIQRADVRPGEFYIRPSEKLVWKVMRRDSYGRWIIRRLTFSDDPKTGARKGRFRRDKNALYEISRDSERLTPDLAIMLGHAFGFCFYCGADLDDPESVRKGVGPICWKRYGQPQMDGTFVYADQTDDENTDPDED